MAGGADRGRLLDSERPPSFRPARRHRAPGRAVHRRIRRERPPPPVLWFSRPACAPARRSPARIRRDPSPRHRLPAPSRGRRVPGARPPRVPGGGRARLGAAPRPAVGASARGLPGGRRPRRRACPRATRRPPHGALPQVPGVPPAFHRAGGVRGVPNFGRGVFLGRAAVGPRSSRSAGPAVRPRAAAGRAARGSPRGDVAQRRT